MATFLKTNSRVLTSTVVVAQRGPRICGERGQRTTLWNPRLFTFSWPLPDLSYSPLCDPGAWTKLGDEQRRFIWLEEKLDYTFMHHAHSHSKLDQGLKCGTREMQSRFLKPWGLGWGNVHYSKLNSPLRTVTGIHLFTSEVQIGLFRR